MLVLDELSFRENSFCSSTANRSSFLKGGDSYQNLAGVPHDARNMGDKPVKLFTVLTIERGEPLASPAP
jgi:hypothetical protein